MGVKNLSKICEVLLVLTGGFGLNIFILTLLGWVSEKFVKNHEVLLVLTGSHRVGGAI